MVGIYVMSVDLCLVCISVCRHGVENEEISKTNKQKKTRLKVNYVQYPVLRFKV